ncbi:MAG: hypothetical protein ACQESJ_07525 [Bacteroidota bacterium]
MEFNGLLIKSIIWIIGFYYFARLVQSKVRTKKYGGIYEHDIPGIFSNKSKTIVGILAFLLIIILPVGIDYSIVLTVGLIYELQKNKIYSNGIKSKENFYSWDNINKIFLPQNSTTLELYINKRSILDKKNVTVSVASDKYKEIVKFLEEKPITLKRNID